MIWRHNLGIFLSYFIRFMVYLRSFQARFGTPEELAILKYEVGGLLVIIYCTFIIFFYSDYAHTFASFIPGHILFEFDNDVLRH